MICKARRAIWLHHSCGDKAWALKGFPVLQQYPTLPAYKIYSIYLCLFAGAAYAAVPSLHCSNPPACVQPYETIVAWGYPQAHPNLNPAPLLDTTPMARGREEGCVREQPSQARKKVMSVHKRGVQINRCVNRICKWQQRQSQNIMHVHRNMYSRKARKKWNDRAKAGGTDTTKEVIGHANTYTASTPSQESGLKEKKKRGSDFYFLFFKKVARLGGEQHI